MATLSKTFPAAPTVGSVQIILERRITVTRIAPSRTPGYVLVIGMTNDNRTQVSWIALAA